MNRSLEESRGTDFLAFETLAAIIDIAPIS